MDALFGGRSEFVPATAGSTAEKARGTALCGALCARPALDERPHVLGAEAPHAARQLDYGESVGLGGQAVHGGAIHAEMRRDLVGREQRLAQRTAARGRPRGGRRRGASHHRIIVIPGDSVASGMTIRRLEDTANLPDPDVLAEEIAEDLRAALEQIEEVLADLRERRDAIAERSGA